MATSVVGLDIGHGVLRAAEVSHGGKSQPKLLRYHEVTFPVDATREGEIVETDVLVRAMKQLWSAGKFSSKDVVLGVGNQRVLTRDLAVAKVPLDRIRETLPFQVQDLLPIPVADAVLDFYPVSEGVADSGPVIHGLLVAAAKNAVLGNVRAVQQAGLNPLDVDLIPFALTRALLEGRPMAGTVALVHIGAVTSCVVVATDGVPQFVRIIPSGGAEVSNALVSGFGMTLAEAESTKARLGLTREVYGSESYAASETVIRVTEDLVGTIRDTLTFYRNTRPADVIASLVLSGGGARLRGLPAAIEEQTRLQVELGDPTQRFVVSKGVDVVTLPNLLPGMAVALGLTLRSAS
jgi:type IV pilus assembly protein PilM